MDILVSNAYVFGMFARVLSMLSILAIAVVTTISAAHAARMDSMPSDHAVHMSEMMQASADADLSCDGSGYFGSSDAAICKFVCAGLSVVLTMPGVGAGQAFGSADHDFPAEAIDVSRAPGLNERPPKLRLL
ncbi:hypothetical protein P1J78_22970 [Psychromarinibacter sp. C21-152]|uniref:Uncharacterized protein n=1 Tax=Psychromarinibacter sediminicola TaxID=3033385 RepID=A0AAE3TCF6_9RHOB|nr:hypothetical protein [Psychromarinibacter sediminicola]MDF0603595.1 hypothetical protein [Psychromarinibacter sediminicola]